jgi:outer membrane protein assembly factor BamD (BamD/ComL family)
MSAVSDGTSLDPDNARYREALAHLQAGRWQDAIRCFDALLRQYPDSELLQQGLADARFKAGIDATTRVRAKRWIVPWRGIVFRLLIIVLVVVAAVAGYRLINRLVAPALQQAQALREQRQLLAEGNARLEAGELDAAEASYTELLALVPDHKEAQQGLAQIKTARELDALYQRAVDLQKSGQFEDALVALTELSVRSPAYRDVNSKIAAIKKQQDLDQLFAVAEADYQAGRDTDAVAKYEQIRALSSGYRGELIAGRMFDLYMRLGSGLITGERPRAEDVPAAADYFSKALALQPRNTQALLEQRLADLYVTAASDYRAGNWERAVSGFEALYAQRPGYLGGQVIEPLYDAYIRTGDQYLGADDCGYAYEQYRKAGALPVSDPSLAVARQEEARPCLTPTPTPSNTPTPTPIPTATPYIPPTEVPSATPVPPLASFRNQIVFQSDKEEQAGFWVMNPDGSNARYLGSSSDLQKQYDALLEKAKLSPDGRFRLYVFQGVSDKSPQIYMQEQQKNQFGQFPVRQVTFNTALSYDPVWAPDGSKIAFVGTEKGSDDIWVVSPDGAEPRNLTPNKWEWDKHPSWSPDSQRLVFWSNREGTKQIFVTDANGQNLKKIHATTWDEYDPIWIK